MKRVVCGLLAFLSLPGEIVTPAWTTDSETGDAISWYGTTRIYVGTYTWPDMEPQGYYNSDSSLVARYDYDGISCSAATNTCTTTTTLFSWGGLPDGTEVKLGTTGTMPSPLKSWSQNRWQVYYVRDWTASSFKLAATAGGPAIDITDAGTGTMGMSFAGYRHVMTFRVSRQKTTFTCDPVTEVCTSPSAHGLLPGHWAYVSSTGTLPGGLYTLRYSQHEAMCVNVLSSTTFTLASKWSEDSHCGNTYPVDITSSGTGTHSIYLREGGPVYVNSLTGYPAGTTITWRVNKTAAVGHSTRSNGYSESNPAEAVVTMFAKVPAITPAGRYSVKVQWSESDVSAVNTKDTAYTLKAITLTPISKHGPARSSYTTIPGYQTSAIPDYPERSWENILVSASNSGGASMPPAQYPRCSNRSDANAPQGYDWLWNQEYSWYGEWNWYNAVELPHNLNSTDVTVRCYRGNSGWVPMNVTASQHTPNSVVANFDTWYNWVACHVSRNGTVGASTNAAPYNMAYTTGGDGNLWFYSDQTFFRLAEREIAAGHDSGWANCGLSIGRAMRDKFYYSGVNSMLGIFYFPWSLVGAYGWTGDPSFKKQLLRITDLESSPRSPNLAGENDNWAMREHAFAFESLLARRAVTGEDDPHLQYYADIALATIYVNSAPTDERTFNQPFMMGLLSRPLIRWYMISHDERVPVVMKLMLDRAWSSWGFRNGVNNADIGQTDGPHFFYNTEPFGTRCVGGCQINSCPGSYPSSFTCRQLNGTDKTDATLNNLIAPAFAWYWRLTGDNIYRDRGDDIFSNVFWDGEPYLAKTWSEVYYWSWDYVDWRLGRKPAY